ncbi:MAG: phosphoribosyl-ATP diphosphatase [Burkholderiales bacterium]|nr:phosphoribosyl-ATP diphosphatase [Burkholderiales bacterium]
MAGHSGHAADANDTLRRLAQTIAARRGADPASSYVAKLLSRAPDAALKKVGEEAAEFIMACKDAELDDSAEDRARVVAEAADVWFHMLVAMSRYQLSGSDVLAELARREGLSGIAEKAARPDASPEVGD